MKRTEESVKAIAAWTGLPQESVEGMPPRAHAYFLDRIALGSAEFPKKLDDCREAWQTHGNLVAIVSALRMCERTGGIPRWLGEAVWSAFTVIMLPDRPSMWPTRLRGRGRHARWLTRYKADIIDFARWDAVMDARSQGLTWAHAYDFATDYLEPTRAGKDRDAIIESVKRVRHRLRAEPFRYVLPTQDLWNLRTPSPEHANAVIDRYRKLRRQKKRG